MLCVMRIDGDFDSFVHQIAILGLDLTIQAELMLCPGIPDRWPLDKVQLRWYN